MVYYGLMLPLMTTLFNEDKGLVQKTGERNS